MAWTAQVVDKRKANGQIHVVVEYSDGASSFRDTLVSRSGQNAQWVSEQVDRRLAELSGVDALADGISLGNVAPVVVNPNAKTQKEKYADKLQKFNGYLSAMRQGIVAVDRPEFLTLKQWLTDNFEDNFIDLFF